MANGGAEGFDHFDELRGRFVEEIEMAREAGDEDQLAEVLRGIIAAAEDDLSSDGLPSDGETVAAVEAWASVLSYATTRFYFEGPESIRRLGGFKKNVVKTLQDAAAQFSRFLQQAAGATGASSFSISISFPWGVSVGLEWDC